MKYSYIFGALASTAYAHTWVEQMMVIAPNGTMVGAPGYPRGNVKRGTPNFGDPAMVNLIPGNGRQINDIRPTDTMCKDSQLKQSQTGDSPRLQAAAGANVALRYQENGHVSLPQGQPGKPENRGTIYVYGTTQPQEDEKFLSIHRVWNAVGTGGDGRGALLATQNYDDGQCYQVNGGEISTIRQKTFSHTANPLMGADLWCQTDIQIPATAESGKPYTLYWVWDWPTLPGTAGFPDGKQEIYTTCMDIDVAVGNDAQSKIGTNNFVKGQDLGSAAVAAQLADIANPTAVTGQTIAFGEQSGVPSPTDNSGKPSPTSATPAPTSAAPTTPFPNTPAPTTPAPSSPAPDSSSTGFTSFQSETATVPSATVPTAAPNASQPANNKPSVSPIGTTSAPFAQSSNGSGRPGGNRDGNRHGRPDSSSAGNQQATGAAQDTAAQNTAVAQNTGTAIANNNNIASTTTATVTGAGTTVTQIQTSIETVYHTKLETVTAAKRAISTDAPVASDSPLEKPACSKTELAYKLKARNPFYILPKNDSGSSAGC